MRRKVAKKHRILPDSKFGDVQVSVFVNNLMKDGKKSTAFKIFYDAIDQVSNKTGEDGLELFKKALQLSGQVCIMFRDVSGVDAGVDGQSDNPFEFEDVKQRIINSLELEGFKNER